MRGVTSSKMGIWIPLFLTLGGYVSSPRVSFAVDCATLIGLSFQRGAKNIRSVEYSNGARALLLGQVGKLRGGTANIWKAILYTSENPEGTIVALRVPKNQNTTHYLEQTIKGYEKLSQTEITIPKLISYSLGEYVAVEFIPHQFTLNEVLMNPERFSEKREKFLFDKFVEFARTTFQWETLPDFEPHQIAFDHVKQRWVFLDWAMPEKMVLHRSTSQQPITLFGKQADPKFDFLEDGFYDQGQKDHIRRAHEAVLDERSRRGN